MPAGDILYWNGSQWISLSAETSGQLLVMKTGFSMGLAIAEKNRLIEETNYYVPVRATECKALNETLKYEQGLIAGPGGLSLTRYLVSNDVVGFRSPFASFR